MIKKISGLNNIEIEQFKTLYTKCFLEETKRTKLGFPLLFELITKKNSKAVAQYMVEEIKADRYLGYAYLENQNIIGFIVGTNEDDTKARITDAYVDAGDNSRHIALELYRKIAVAFKVKGKSKITIESHLYNTMLRVFAESNFFDVTNEYPDGYIEYEKRL